MPDEFLNDCPLRTRLERALDGADCSWDWSGYDGSTDLLNLIMSVVGESLQPVMDMHDTWGDGESPSFYIGLYCAAAEVREMLGVDPEGAEPSPPS